MLTPAQIAERETRYSCCAFDFLVKSMRAEIVGETANAKRFWAQSLKIHWAARVMANTTIDGGCYTVQYATLVAREIDCLCPNQYGCDCGDTNCDIFIDDEAIVVPCDTEVDAWVMSASGIEELNGLVFVPVPIIPEATPGTTTYEAAAYTMYRSEADGEWVIDETIGTHLYTSASFGGAWSVDTGASPAPTMTQATLADLCSTDLTGEEKLALAVPLPEDGIYALTCCDETEFFVFESIEPGTGLDYELDSPIN